MEPIGQISGKNVYDAKNINTQKEAEAFIDEIIAQEEPVEVPHDPIFGWITEQEKRILKRKALIQEAKELEEEIKKHKQILREAFDSRGMRNYTTETGYMFYKDIDFSVESKFADCDVLDEWAAKYGHKEVTARAPVSQTIRGLVYRHKFGHKKEKPEDWFCDGDIPEGVTIKAWDVIKMRKA